MLTISTRRFSFARNSSALAAFACLALPGAYAQQVAPAMGHTASPALFASATTRSMDFADVPGVSYSSSSSSVDESIPGAEAATLPLVNVGVQPAPRRRYGSPRYSDNMHNGDGSNKYVFEAAAGFELPTGDTYHYFNTSYAFQVGAGRQFNKHLAVLVQFDYDHFGINSQTLQNQSNIYNGIYNAGFSSLDGSNHVWSFSLNPVYTFYQGDKYGAYVVAGVGFYHKVTNFTTPQPATYFDPFYGPITYEANATIDTYTSNAPGFNGGFGLTYKFSRFADERFFIEGRYVFVNNSQRTGLTIADSTQAPYGTPNGPGSTYSGTDYFPANSNRTEYIPIKIGIRF